MTFDQHYSKLEVAIADFERAVAAAKADGFGMNIQVVQPDNTTQTRILFVQLSRGVGKRQ